MRRHLGETYWPQRAQRSQRSSPRQAFLPVPRRMDGNHRQECLCYAGKPHAGRKLKVTPLAKRTADSSRYSSAILKMESTRC
jgi:hypothetical protein